MLNLVQRLSKYNIQSPRYTSYPTAPHWEEIQASIYENELQNWPGDPLSLYLHIPFCASMCLFCGCSVILNRKSENEAKYVDYLCREIAQVSSYLPQKKQKISQLHFGGGTPTKLSENLLSKIMTHLHSYFAIEADAEIAIEIDPRTVSQDQGQKLAHLKQLGFNRVSFGVQDTNPLVQEAIKRKQSLEMTQSTFYLAKHLGFKGINVDLIYGLPFQTLSTFQKTISDILELSPDRIALFSYAQIPHLKPHQKAISSNDLPTTEEKFAIYEKAREKLIAAGYVAIGMDHFAKEHDELALSYYNKTLQRNFQGYTVKRARGLIGFGLTSIGNLDHLYVQNHKTLEKYYEALDQGLLPVTRGKLLNEEDKLRRYVIHTLMCHFEIDKVEFFSLFSKNFDDTFFSLHSTFVELEKEGLIKNFPSKLQATALGELFIRNIVLHFDAYFISNKAKYSYSI